MHSLYHNDVLYRKDLCERFERFSYTASKAKVAWSHVSVQPGKSDDYRAGREAPVGASSYPIKNQRQDIKCLAFKIKSGPELYCNTTINTTNNYSNKLNFINI